MTQGRDRVIIAGGGIGGLGAALMLARRGVPVTVLERAAEFKEVGAGLQLAPNITRMLDEVGVLADLLPHAVRPRRLVLANAATGEELSRLDLEDAATRYGGPYLVLHRSDLLDTLLRAARAEPAVTLLTDHRVERITDHGDGVTVTCAGGQEVTGRVLVGADGLRSVVRKHVVDDEPVCSGYVAYRGVVPIETVDRLSDTDDVVVWMGPGCHFVQYPVRGGKLYNQVAVFRSQEYLDGKEDWGSPAELDAAYADLATPVVAGLASIQRENRWPMYDREPISTWTNGNVTLLGDAAHAMLQYLAQGAGQSLLDGAALADALAPLADGPDGGHWSAGDVKAALHRYEADRVAAAATVQSTGRLWGDIWHVDEPVQVLLRDEAFRRRDTYDYHLVDWLYGPVLDPGDHADAVGNGPRPADTYRTRK